MLASVVQGDADTYNTSLFAHNEFFASVMIKIGAIFCINYISWWSYATF